MTENELKLLSMIREHNNPEQALIIAIETIISYLKQFESFEEPSVAVAQVLV